MNNNITLSKAKSNLERATSAVQARLLALRAEGLDLNGPCSDLYYHHSNAANQKTFERHCKTAAKDGIIRNDTVLGERGSRLSTGQRQLLSLARTLARKPRILILDEATASIDSHTEALVQQALQTLRGHITLISIAHRLSTIMAADTILVLHQGRIMQQGSHQALMARDGLYRHMHELQQRRGDVEEGSPGVPVAP